MLKISYIPFIFLFLLSVSGETFAVSGDIVPTTDMQQVPVIEDTTVLSIPTSFTFSQKEALAKTTFKFIFDKQTWKFVLPPDSYTLKEQWYVLVNGVEIPLSENIEITDFPVIKKIAIEIPKSVLVAYIKKTLIPSINRSKQDVTIKQVEEKIVFEGTAENGQAVDINAVIRAIAMAIEKNITSIAVPVIEQPAQIYKEGLGDLRVEELMSVGVSDFSGSPRNRVHNINIGIKKFDGIIIKQDQDFSFLDHLGPVDKAHGFLPELVIKGADTIPEFGGGLCQVSTTMFRSALFAGLPILERRNHSYAVQYYVWPLGWGFDATVYIGAVDLKFKNDTPGDILVQAYTDGTKAYYKFYGIKDARKVDINGPFITGRRGPPPTVMIPTSSLPAGTKQLKERAHGGLSAYFLRTIITSTGEEIKEKFTSVYQARPMVYLVGETTSTPQENSTDAPPAP